jgi:hypothetical protein
MIVIPKDWENHPDPQVRLFIEMAAWMINEKDNEDIRETPGDRR